MLKRRSAQITNFRFFTRMNSHVHPKLRSTPAHLVTNGAHITGQDTGARLGVEALHALIMLRAHVFQQIGVLLESKSTGLTGERFQLRMCRHVVVKITLVAYT